MISLPLILTALISLAVASTGCSLCPRVNSTCVYGGIKYTNCLQGQNNVYYATVGQNTQCKPLNINDGTTYFGYNSNGVVASCYNSSCPSDCYPPARCNNGATNCQLGMYAISAYGSSSNFLFRIYCYLQPKDSYDSYRGDLYHDCSNSTYGGVYYLPSAPPSGKRKRTVDASVNNPGPTKPTTNAPSSTPTKALTEVPTKLPTTAPLTNAPTSAPTTEVPTERPTTESPTTEAPIAPVGPGTRPQCFSFPTEEAVLVVNCSCDNVTTPGILNCTAANSSCVEDVMNGSSSGKRYGVCDNP